MLSTSAFLPVWIRCPTFGRPAIPTGCTGCTRSLHDVVCLPCRSKAWTRMRNRPPGAIHRGFTESKTDPLRFRDVNGFRLLSKPPMLPLVPLAERVGIRGTCCRADGSGAAYQIKRIKVPIETMLPTASLLGVIVVSLWSHCSDLLRSQCVFTVVSHTGTDRRDEMAGRFSDGLRRVIDSRISRLGPGRLRGCLPKWSGPLFSFPTAFRTSLPRPDGGRGRPWPSV